MYDMLTKMLQYPIFLDSAKLTDLRELITHVVVVLGTKGYITRPWCLYSKLCTRRGSRHR